MKFSRTYKQSHFILRDVVEPDIIHWESDDELYTITTSTHPGADFFVMKKEQGQWVQTGVKGTTLLNTINKLNNHINGQ